MQQPFFLRKEWRKIEIVNFFQEKIEGYSFILPGFVYTLIVLGYPLVYNIILAFKDLNVKNFKSGTSVFVGFQNFIELFQDPTFRLVFGNTLKFTLACLIVQFTLGFLFALFFSQKFTLSGPIRGLILIAYMMPMSVTALMGKNLFDVSSGVINDLLMKIGLIQQPLEWLLKGNTAMAAVIAMNCWVGIPFNMLLLTSGLTGIPQEIYESAAIDGATAWTKFRYITLPLMKSSIAAVLMLGFIYTFKAFDLQFVMTNGGPLNATDVLGTYSYRLSFTQYEFSRGAAVAMVLFACLFAIGLFYLRMISKEDD